MSASLKLSGKIVIASHNKGKVREIGALLEPFGLEAISAGDLGLREPEETEATFIGNAALKARAACLVSGLPALADDSGLEVRSLGGAPGVLSARWGGPEKDFNFAMARVWRELEAKDAWDKSARFVCALALARPGEDILTFEGEARGRIVWPPRGDQGFGYDPIFAPEGYERTFGEMSADEKAPLAHRTRAFEQLVAALS
jgi:XTP/dITP diphosphohydrolase